MTIVTTIDESILKVKVLTEALPYIRTYRGRTVVVKIGGEAIENDRAAILLAEDLALLALVGIRLVVVHGGGPQVSRAMAKAGITPQFVGGLRVTDLESIDMVRQVLIGTLNSEIVSRLCGAGLRAVGLSGADASLFEAERRVGPQGEDLGRVGRISTVRSELVETLLGHGYTPVVASVASGTDTGFYNVNADTAASALASSLGAAKLVYLTNVEGLYRDLGDSDSLVSELVLSELEAMLPSLSDGMQPKAEGAIDALSTGVGKVHILDGRTDHALLLEIFTSHGIGTQVLP
ncbi:MAG: acetylglutamate kinase [Actinomycetota bacterium]